jgi:hypothetical protein
LAKRSKVAGDVNSPKRSAVLMPTLEPAENLAGVAIQAGRHAEGKRRKPGKRSDPAFRATTFFVRKDTQRKASRLLEDQETGKDLSDLVEELLAKWIDDNSNG